MHYESVFPCGIVCGFPQGNYELCIMNYELITVAAAADKFTDKGVFRNKGRIDGFKTFQ